MGTLVISNAMELVLFGLCLFGILVALAVIDFRTFILPDFLTLPLIIIGLSFAHTQNIVKPAIIGAIIGFTMFVMLEITYKHIRGKAGLGRGDAKLLAAGGAWCGWYGLPFIILIASGFGLVHALLLAKKNSDALPFGPHLAIGIFLTWLSLFVLT